jgi:hypothetical protein
MHSTFCWMYSFLWNTFIFQFKFPSIYSTIFSWQRRLQWLFLPMPWLALRWIRIPELAERLIIITVKLAEKWSDWKGYKSRYIAQFKILKSAGRHPNKKNFTNCFFPISIFGQLTVLPQLWSHANKDGKWVLVVMSNVHTYELLS